MKIRLNLTKLLLLVFALLFVLSSCSSIYEHMPDNSEDTENLDLSEEYFTEGEVWSAGSANLGIIYEGQWIYVDKSEVVETVNSSGEITSGSLQRIVKYNPVTNTVSSLCLNPTCFHSSEDCLFCAPHGWIVSYVELLGDWILYSFINPFPDNDEFEIRKTYLCNLKTGESRDLLARNLEGNLATKRTISYVINGKIYSSRFELDYTGEEEHEASSSIEPFVPDTHHYIEVYDPETEKTETLCEVSIDYLLIAVTNKRFIFLDSENVTHSCNYKGENMTVEENMPNEFYLVCGSYSYPAVSYDYSKVGFNTKGYDLISDSMFNIDLGVPVQTITIDSGKLCYTTTSNIEEYKVFAENPDKYVKELYPDVTDKAELRALKQKVREYLRYSGTFMLYFADARGENRKLVFEGQHMKFTPSRVSGDYVFGSVTYGDPNNNFERLDTEEDGNCVLNIKTGEITLIPQLEIHLDKQQ